MSTRLLPQFFCLRFPYLLIRLHTSRDNWDKIHLVKSLGETKCAWALNSLMQVARDEIPGYWVEDMEQTMQDLKKHFAYEDDLIDHINASIRSRSIDLRKAAIDAVVQIGGKQALRALKTLANG